VLPAFVAIAEKFGVAYLNALFHFIHRYGKAFYVLYYPVGQITVAVVKYPVNLLF